MSLCIAGQFAHGGTEGLENPHIFEMAEVRAAGGLPALKAIGDAGQVLQETKDKDVCGIIDRWKIARVIAPW